MIFRNQKGHSSHYFGRGFTFLEVMVALAILAVALVSAIRAQSQSMVLLTRTQEITMVTELARSKMAELELNFKGKGFGEIPEKDAGAFAAESLQGYRWSYVMRKLEIPGNVDTPQGSGGSQGPVGMGFVKDFLAKAVREMKFTIAWGPEKREQNLTITSFLTSTRELPNIQFLGNNNDGNPPASGGNPPANSGGTQ